MSKTSKGYAAEDFKHVTPKMIAAAERVVADQKTRRYSVSTIYTAHNGIFKLHEPYQTCDSCLVTRANAVAKWLAWYEAQGKDAAKTTPPAPDNGDVNAVSKWLSDNGGLGDGVQTTTPPAPEPTADSPQITTPPPAAPESTEILIQQVEKDDYSKTKGDPLYALFTATAGEEGKGQAINKETGKALAAGTYATEDVTKVLSVGVGGRAVYKPV